MATVGTIRRQSKRRVELPSSMRGNTFSLDILQLAIARRHGLAQIASFDERLRDAAAILGFEVLPARS